MRTTLAAVALITAAFAAPLAPSIASAQGFGVTVGEDGARVRVGDPERRVVRERIRDRGYDDRRVVVRERSRDCRVIVDRRVNRMGETVVRRTRVCG